MASFGGRVMERSQSKNQASDSDSAGEGVGWQSAGDTSRIMDKALELNRKKDIICLILSYPPFSSVIQGSHKGWILDVLAINQKLREAVYRKKVINVSELFSRISRQIDHSIDDIEAYVPRHIIEEMQRGTIWGRTPTTKVYSLAIDFAVRQIIQDRETPEFQRIYISGRDDAGILMSRLKNLQQEKGMFDLAIHVKASSCKTAGDIEYGIARELGLSTSSRQEVDVLLQSKSFLILLDGVDLASSTNLSEVGTNWWNSKKFQKMVCTTSSMGRGVNHTEVDLEIRLEDHLLTWELFCMNVGNVVHSSGIQRLAIRVVKECEGHLLAIVLMARALREVDEVHTWEYASHALALQPTRLRDYVLFNALAFICGRLGSAMYCLKFFVHMGCWREIEKGDVIGRWISGGLIRKADEGEEMVRDLVDAFLLESSGNGDSVFLRVRGEIYEALLILLGHKTELLFLWQCGKGLTDPPIEEMWKTASEVHLMNNKLSELPRVQIALNSGHCSYKPIMV
ncbi:disease resistance protein At4g27190-like [Vitis riparia]|uniref:disease resistance protein At4g27190-like n=1 Tax=Vitis riparia TaxID=96939 RepID=UPI00155A0643|nr:disease resistance protein At4g27190-like [Vitis riparia]